MAQTQRCGHCGVRPGQSGVTKLFLCSRCGVQPYCSVQCQRASWKVHKPKCFSTEEKKTLRAVKKETTVKACAKCSKTAKSTGTALKSCALCRDVYYCSPECQKKDWGQHKVICNSQDHAQVRKKKPQNNEQKRIQELTVAAIKRVIVLVKAVLTAT